MAIIDDLTGLLAPDGPAASEFRQGVVTAIDLNAGTSTISVGGQFLVNVPFVSPADAINYLVGTVVLLLRVGASWCVLGRPGAPGYTPGLVTSHGGTDASGQFTPIITNSTLMLTATATVPSWANTASVITITRANAINNSASDAYLHSTVDIKGDGAAHKGNNGAVGGTAGYAAVGKYAFVVASNIVSNIAVSAGSLTILANLWTTQGSGTDLSWGSGSGTVNELVIDYIATFTRT